MWALALCAVIAVLLDRVLGEPKRWHPLVGFGRVAGAVERRLNTGLAAWRRVAGVVAVVSLVLLPAVAVGVVAMRLSPVAALLLHTLLLTFAIGARSLHDHLRPIAAALTRGDLASARQLTGRIVSRDTEGVGAEALAKAAVESALENGNDAVFGALFWFALAGGPGALAFRLANTLDAMWGYRSPRYAAFGWAAARFDDVLNWVPARLTATSYGLLGQTRRAWRCWCEQAPAWPSPNAGPVMAAGAGALGLLLGGEARYDGHPEQRPPLGHGRAAHAGDILRALRLVDRTLVLWLGVWLVGVALLGAWR